MAESAGTINNVVATSMNKSMEEAKLSTVQDLSDKLPSFRSICTTLGITLNMKS